MAVIMMFAILGFLGLVVDGGNYLSAKQDASAVADQAARLGVDQLSGLSLRVNTPQVNFANAEGAADHYMATHGYPGATATVIPQNVNGVVTYAVQVSDSFNSGTILLSAIGIRSIPVSVTETAVPLVNCANSNAAGYVPPTTTASTIPEQPAYCGSAPTVPPPTTLPPLTTLPPPTTTIPPPPPTTTPPITICFLGICV